MDLPLKMSEFMKYFYLTGSVNNPKKCFICLNFQVLDGMKEEDPLHQQTPGKEQMVSKPDGHYL